MSKPKFTPGEWKVRFFHDDKEEGDFFVESRYHESQSGSIEIMMDDYGDHNGYTREQRLADAYLIAASKNLYESCKKAYEILSPISHQWQGRETADGQFFLAQLLAALNKAEGK